MSATPQQIEAGQAVYTKRVLALYDYLVLGFSNRFIWKCPSQRIQAHYDRHITTNHLDVGVGTGYFLDRCRFPSTPHLTLVDLNPNSLEFASNRLARYKPQTFKRNVLEPIEIGTSEVDSVAVSYVLHCVPGTIESKAAAFDHLKDLMNPAAVLFGSTLLQGGVAQTWYAKRLMNIYNAKGIFCNERDDLEGLRRALAQRFRDVSVEVVGCVALFAGRA